MSHSDLLNYTEEKKKQDIPYASNTKQQVLRHSNEKKITSSGCQQNTKANLDKT